MATEKVLMREVDLDINTGTEASPVWTAVAKRIDITHSPSTNRTDITDVESAGREEHRVTRRGDTFSGTYHVMEDVSSGARDAGQEALEALAGEMGEASIGQFRITTPGGTTMTFKASAQVQLFGGGPDDYMKASFELVVTASITVA